MLPGMRFVLFCFILQFFVVHGAPAQLVVQLQTGTFQGVGTDNGTERWLGIPFAQPPIGNLRFKAPVAISKPVRGVQDASTFKDACPQPPGSLGAPIGEDCLGLNVILTSIE